MERHVWRVTDHRWICAELFRFAWHAFWRSRIHAEVFFGHLLEETQIYHHDGNAFRVAKVDCCEEYLIPVEAAQLNEELVNLCVEFRLCFVIIRLLYT